MKSKCCREGCRNLGKWKVAGNPLFVVCDKHLLELSRSSGTGEVVEQVVVGPSEVKEEKHEGQKDS